MLVEVAVAAPVFGTFTYEAEGAEPGRRMLVPFGRRRAIGFCLGPATTAPATAVRGVERLLDDGPVLPADVLELIRFAADYYLHPLGEALRSALPPELSRVAVVDARRREAPIETVELSEAPEVALAALSRSRAQAAVIEHLTARGGAVPLLELKVAVKGAAQLLKKLEARGLVRLTRAAPRTAEEGSPFEDSRVQPTEDQTRALSAITGAAGTFRPFLLRGVTGSGKTEVYLRAIAEARQRGQGALVLVPEIALTPQLAGRFRGRFGQEVAVLHSGLTDTERSREHRRLLSGEARIAVGVRSAVFAPVQDLGIVVVDEEHDGSFKQEEKLRYHARDLAVVRARLRSAPCILGSATPSLESLANATSGRYALLEMPTRAHGRPLPSVEVIDLARPRGSPRPAAPDILSAPLAKALGETLDAGRQAILFLNRRGHATLVLCPSCGEAFRCPQCDVALTHHLHARQLRCHYCDHRQPVPPDCPSCGAELLVLGVGTERVEKEIASRFPAARVLRLDRDSVGSPGELTRILASFARGEADVLVGTQMVAKGHDFPGVTLVGVVLADVGLTMPDFRASERTFQLLAQVAGRAGRGVDPGRVLLQTFHPQADAVRFALSHDHAAFAERELRRREELGYPPSSRMLLVRVDATLARHGEEMARALAGRVNALSGLRVLGPAAAPIARLRGRHRFQLLLLARAPATIHAAGKLLQEASARPPHDVRVALDVDPVSML